MVADYFDFELELLAGKYNAKVKDGFDKFVRENNVGFRACMFIVLNILKSKNSRFLDDLYMVLGLSPLHYRYGVCWGDVIDASNFLMHEEYIFEDESGRLSLNNEKVYADILLKDAEA